MDWCECAMWLLFLKKIGDCTVGGAPGIKKTQSCMVVAQLHMVVAQYLSSVEAGKPRLSFVGHSKMNAQLRFTCKGPATQDVGYESE